MTRGEYIRSMSDDTLAEWLAMIEHRILFRNKWLESQTLKKDWLEYLQEEMLG